MLRCAALMLRLLRLAILSAVVAAAEIDVAILMSQWLTCSSVPSL